MSFKEVTSENGSKIFINLDNVVYLRPFNAYCEIMLTSGKVILTKTSIEDILEPKSEKTLKKSKEK